MQDDPMLPVCYHSSFFSLFHLLLKFAFLLASQVKQTVDTMRTSVTSLCFLLLSVSAIAETPKEEHGSLRAAAPLAEMNTDLSAFVQGGIAATLTEEQKTELVQSFNEVGDALFDGLASLKVCHFLPKP